MVVSYACKYTQKPSAEQILFVVPRRNSICEHEVAKYRKNSQLMFHTAYGCQSRQVCLQKDGNSVFHLRWPDTLSISSFHGLNKESFRFRKISIQSLVLKICSSVPELNLKPRLYLITFPSFVNAIMMYPFIPLRIYNCCLIFLFLLLHCQPYLPACLLLQL